MIKTLLAFIACCLSLTAAAQDSTPQWECYETAFQYHTDKNPFTDVELTAVFTHESGITLTVCGFYDGDDRYLLRFMPTMTGRWTYKTWSRDDALNAREGVLTCTPPLSGRHGMVKAAGQDFVYADKTPYRPVGTTSYAWIHADRDRQELTYRSLDEAKFNKLRFCVFPNNSVNELPKCYPFEVTSCGAVSEGEWQGDRKAPSPFVFDYTRFDTRFFQHLDTVVTRLKNLGIEADVILFTPYDAGFWGFDRMSRETNMRYLRYVVARLSAYSNVWWSMANEWDLVRAKRSDEWQELTQTVAQADPYHHLLSIHGGTAVYVDYNNPLYTHASIQDQGPLYNFEGAATVRNIIHKPVIFDEVCYEGNLRSRWAQLSGEEMLERIWTGLLAGTYVTHGECFGVGDNDYTGYAFLATGGRFEGTCPRRIPFLRQLIDALPNSPRLADQSWDPVTATAGEGHYLVYFGHEKPSQWTFSLPAKNSRWPRLKEGETFTVDIIDTWNMTVTRCKDTFLTASDGTRYRMVDKGGKSVKLPKKPWLLLHIHH